MKKKIRNSIFVVSIVYSCIIVLLALFTYSKATNVVEIRLERNDRKLYVEKIDLYKSELNSIKNNVCRDEISKMISYFERTMYNGKFNMKEKFFSDDYFLSYVGDTYDKCNIPDTEKRLLGDMVLGSSIQFDSLLQKYLFQYEIRITDSMREVIEPEMKNTFYRINREYELEFINRVIELSKEEK